jgi:hypothetical protein
MPRCSPKQIFERLNAYTVTGSDYGGIGYALPLSLFVRQYQIKPFHNLGNGTIPVKSHPYYKPYRLFRWQFAPADCGHPAFSQGGFNPSDIDMRLQPFKRRGECTITQGYEP